MISGFTFVHNALHAGIPIREAIQAVRPYVDEMVVVDAGSDDGTTDMLCSMGEIDRILLAPWGTDAGETLTRLHAMHTECKGDIIIHFEADEVFDDGLLEYIKHFIVFNHHRRIQLSCYRIQVEQNFQRVRWYSELVHRVFMKGTVNKVGHTTDKHSEAHIIDPKHGLLWDITNCFRDQFLVRIDQQAKLWGGEHNYKMVPRHFNHPIDIGRGGIEAALLEAHWTFKTTSLAIPEILKPLVGKVKYD